MPRPELWPLWCGVVLSLVAAAINWKTFKVPNWLTLGAAAAGMIVGLLSTVGVVPVNGGIFSALGAGVLGFVLLAPAYVTGRLGAANVKMQMAFGIWLGCAFSAGIAALLMLAATFVGSVLGNFQRAMKKRRAQELPPAEAADPKQALMAVQLPLSVGAVIAVLIPLAFGWV